jgi:4-diphosphocytidyl-2-C-methyl-D-erythritol kinase
VPDDLTFKDLEPPAFTCLLELAALKQELLGVDRFDHVMMSGSGTSIFCLGEPTDRGCFKRKCTERGGLQVFFSEFINRPTGVWFEAPSQR